MSKHYYKDTMTGRVTVVHRSEHFDAEAFQARLNKQAQQQDQINALAERLAIRAGFTRSEYRAAPTRTRSRWQTRALDELISEGQTFDPIIDELNRPIGATA